MGLEIKPCCQYVGTLTLHGVICGYRYRNEPFPNYGVLHSFAFMFDVGVITTLCHSRCKKSYSVHPLHTSHHHESSFERFFSVLVLFSCRVVSGAFGWRCRHQTVAPKERHAFFSKYVAPLTDVFVFWWRVYFLLDVTFSNISTRSYIDWLQQLPFSNWRPLTHHCKPFVFFCTSSLSYLTDRRASSQWFNNGRGFT